MFRFTTRDVLWLTVVVAMVFAWWIDHAGKMQSQWKAKELERMLIKDGWSVTHGHWSLEMERIKSAGAASSYHKSTHINRDWTLPLP